MFITYRWTWKLFFSFRITCNHESLTIRPKICDKKVYIFNFDYILKKIFEIACFLHLNTIIRISVFYNNPLYLWEYYFAQSHLILFQCVFHLTAMCYNPVPGWRSVIQIHVSKWNLLSNALQYNTASHSYIITMTVASEKIKTESSMCRLERMEVVS